MVAGFMLYAGPYHSDIKAEKPITYGINISQPIYFVKVSSLIDYPTLLAKLLVISGSK